MNADDRTALAGLATEERLRAGDLIAELNSRARRIGLNTTDWPGLTMYRFEAPVVPQWSEVHALSLNVGAIARTVGYSSLSHFVNEFKRSFGVTPRSYADSQRDVVPLRMDLATGPVRG